MLEPLVQGITNHSSLPPNCLTFNPTTSSMALADYKSNRITSPRYDYQVDASQPIESKIHAFREFLLSVKDDCSVSFSTKEPGQYVHGISSNAHSTSTNEKSSIYIGLNTDRNQNEAEYNALHQEWVDTLDISLKLEKERHKLFRSQANF
jgi:hypothetical protein